MLQEELGKPKREPRISGRTDFSDSREEARRVSGMLQVLPRGLEVQEPVFQAVRAVERNGP